MKASLISDEFKAIAVPARFVYWTLPPLGTGGIPPLWYSLVGNKCRTFQFACFSNRYSDEIKG